MKLYHRKGAGRPIRCRWALAEAGIDHEVEILSDDECAGSDHRERQPLNRVPVLDDGKGPIFESAAILFHIADLAGPGVLIAEPGAHERALVYQWVLFNMTEIEPPFVEPILHPEGGEERTSNANEALDRAIAIVEHALDGGKHLVGDSFTLADLVIVDTLLLTTMFVGREHSPALQAYIDEHEKRPARAKAAELHAA